jgi:hypothetical protein
MALILDDKASENLDAAERLLQDDVGQEWLPNAPANRSISARQRQCGGSTACE